MQAQSVVEAQQALIEEILALRVALLAAYASFAQERSLALLFPRPAQGPVGAAFPRLGVTIPNPVPAATNSIAATAAQQAYTTNLGSSPQPLPGGSVSLISILA